MFKESLLTISELALKKKKMLEGSRLRYLLAAALAGAYIGLGIVLIFVIGGPLLGASSPFTYPLMGISFGVALTLVIFAGSELFTSNIMVFTIGALTGATTWKDAFKNWFWCYLGNFLGAVTLSLLIIGAGTFDYITFDNVLFKIASKKMNLDGLELFFRGMLGNWLVSLAVWSAYRTKSETAKIMLIFVLLYTFFASGYEHSIANMTLLTLAVLLPHPDTISIAGWFSNLIPVTLGNIVGGGLLLGVAYWVISPIKVRKQDEISIKISTKKIPSNQ